MAPVFRFGLHSLRIWFGGVLLVFGTVPLWIGAGALTTERRYRDEARTAHAEVVDKALHPATSNRVLWTGEPPITSS